MNNRSRTKNSIHNISVGFVVTVVNTLITFISRKVLVIILGVEALGLNGLFGEVIAMLSLAELGIGMAIVYSLYKPISENDEKKISQLMGLYRSAYNMVALVTFLLGLLITPFVDKLITDINYPLPFIRTIFVLFVIRTSSSYLFSYKTSLLNADQKQYIVSIITVIVKTVMTLAIIICLLVYKNYIFYLILLIIQNLVINLVLSWRVDKIYPFINYKETIDETEKKQIFDNIRNVFIKRVSGVITNSTDHILISVFVSTIQVCFYDNYIILFSVVKTIKQHITNGLAASIGNLMVTSDEDNCISVLKRLTYMYYVFAMIMTSGLMGGASLFIKMWLGEKYVMSYAIVCVVVFNLFLDICGDPLWQFLEVSGLFKKDKNIGLIGSSINLVVSLLLVMKMGMIGIFIGTSCTLIIQIILKTILLFKDKFDKAFTEYAFMWCKMLIGYGLLIFVQLFMINRISLNSDIVTFLLKCVFSVLAAIIISESIFFNSNESKYLFENAKNCLNNRIDMIWKR